MWKVVESFCLDEGEVIHGKCGDPMTLWRRDFSGEERWFCVTCMESVYIPKEAWQFLVENAEVPAA